MDQVAQPSTKKFYKKWWFWTVIVIIFIVAASSSKSPSKSVPAKSDSEATASTSSATPQAAPAVPQTLLSLSGKGTKTTQKFTAAGDWDLNWSYDCSNFGFDGNFIVTVYNESGSLSFRNTGVNQLGKSGKDVEHYHAGGTFYLVVNSVCSWKMEAKG